MIKKILLVSSSCFFFFSNSYGKAHTSSASIFQINGTITKVKNQNILVLYYGQKTLAGRI
jgi:hypothetical protein